MEQETPSRRDKIFKMVSLTEKAVLLITAAGFVFNDQNFVEGKSILLIGLIGTALTWFVLSFKPIELFNSQQEADEFGPLGFAEMLAFIISPRVLWISSSISIFGVIAYVADFGNDGYIRGLITGGFGILLCLLILLRSLFMGVKKLTAVVPILFRALPVLLVVTYILFG